MSTPNEKTKFKNTAQLRALTVFSAVNNSKRIESDYYVEGYAAKFEPYVLYSDEIGNVYEQFERDCFAGTDMSDIIMQFDHAGHVLARTGNGTLIVEVDENGLFIAADLSKTERARQLYDEIRAGMITKMSWRFILGEYEYDPKTRTFTHHTVKKIYDVSAVSIPANDDTEINARSWADGEIGLRARRDAELDDRKKRLKTKIIIGGIINE